MLILSQEQLALFNRRDHKIYDLVFRHYYGPVYLYVFYKIKNETDAEDIAMKVFEELYFSKTTFEQSENINVWLFWTARNRCLDFWLQQEKHNALIRELTGQQKVKESENNNAQLQNDMQAMDALVAILHQLPGKNGQVARLFFLHDFTHEEIANELNISLNNVSKLLMYSIMAMQRRLGLI